MGTRCAIQTNLEAFLDEPSYYFFAGDRHYFTSWKSKHMDIRSSRWILQGMRGRSAFGSKARVHAVRTCAQHLLYALRSFMLYCTAQAVTSETLDGLRPRTTRTIKGCKGEEIHRSLQHRVFKVANRNRQ